MATWVRFSVVLLVVLASSLLVHPSVHVANPTGASSSLQSFGSGIHRTYWLVGSSMVPGIGWNGSLPGPDLMANDGDNVTIMLQSGDSMPHSWFLDFNNNSALDPNEVATRSPDFDSSTNPWLNFTFPASLGTTIPHGGTMQYVCQQHSGLMKGFFRFYAGPVASFTHSPSTPLVGHPVSFDGSGSYPSIGSTITNYNWSFGDGNTTSSGSNSTIMHTYGTNGIFTVVLTITDGASQTGQATGNVTITSSTGFDYRITTSTSNVDIAAGL